MVWWRIKLGGGLSEECDRAIKDGRSSFESKQSTLHKISSFIGSTLRLSHFLFLSRYLQVNSRLVNIYESRSILVSPSILLTSK